jgi:hypothetical protein
MKTPQVTPLCSRCNDTGMVAIRSRDGREWRRLPLPTEDTP